MLLAKLLPELTPNFPSSVWNSIEVSRLSGLTAIAALASLDSYDFSVLAAVSDVVSSISSTANVPRHIDGMGCVSVVEVLVVGRETRRRDLFWRGIWCQDLPLKFLSTSPTINTSCITAIEVTPLFVSLNNYHWLGTSKFTYCGQNAPSWYSITVLLFQRRPGISK